MLHKLEFNQHLQCKRIPCSANIDKVLLICYVIYMPNDTVIILSMLLNDCYDAI